MFLIASALVGQGSALSNAMEDRLEHLITVLESELDQEDMVRGARGSATDADMLTGWKKTVYQCHKRAVVAACPTIGNKDLCQASLESRSGVYSGVQINNAKCVWCENGCTDRNPGGKCEPKNWLEKQADSRDWEICPASNNPYHTFLNYNLMDTNINLLDDAVTQGHSKCYSEASCMQMLMIQEGWITSPTCTSCGRGPFGGRRLDDDEEYHTVTMEIDPSMFTEEQFTQIFPHVERRRFHNPTFMMEEMQVTSNVLPFIKARNAPYGNGRQCVPGDAITNTGTVCALNADICIRMECDSAGMKPDWGQQTDCAAGFIRTVCKK